jgi:hypothetical protein
VDNMSKVNNIIKIEESGPRHSSSLQLEHLGSNREHDKHFVP